MSVDAFPEWTTGVDLDLEEPYSHDLSSDSRLFSTDHCITLDQPSSDIPSSSIVKFTSSHSNHFKPDPPTTEASSQTTCPSCKKTLDTSIHAHVGPCFVASKQLTARVKKENVKESSDSLFGKIQSIRESAARMSLSHRIGLLESLSRLAMLAKASESGAVPSQHNRQIDLFTLDLLYKSPDAPAPPVVEKSKKRQRRHESLTVDVRPTKAPFFNEAFTPTANPSPRKLPSAAFSLSDSFPTATPPPVHVKAREARAASSIGYKRKRRHNDVVVQALRFTPPLSASETQPAPEAVPLAI